jgi:uncharacterized RDD family membrane protein YckC
MTASPRFAGIPPRFLALLADLALFCAIFFPVTRLVKGVWLMGPGDHRWNAGAFVFDPLCGIFLGLMFLYFVLLEGLCGATVGKWVAGIRVEGEGGGRPGLWKSAVRNALRIVDGLPALNLLGVLLVLGSRERTRFGDMAAGTRVLHRRGEGD